MKILILSCCCILLQAASAQPHTDTIRLNFLYGSVPAKGFEQTEKKLFGGLKGGHVNIEAGGSVLDFRPTGNCHLIPLDNNPNGGFHVSQSIYWDTATTKWLSIKIPVDRAQMQELQAVFSEYATKTPYDYAVFGMRCAAASYDVLSEIGLFRKMSNKNNIITNFYPKLLRKRMIKWAKKNNYAIQYHEGRSSRKWETDEGIF